MNVVDDMAIEWSFSRIHGETWLFYQLYRSLRAAECMSQKRSMVYFVELQQLFLSGRSCREVDVTMETFEISCFVSIELYKIRSWQVLVPPIFFLTAELRLIGQRTNRMLKSEVIYEGFGSGRS